MGAVICAVAELRVDHVICAAGDLDVAAARFWDESGLGSVAGGVHLVEYAVSPRRIAWIEVAAEPGTVQAWLGEDDLPLRITEGPQALSAFGIATANGELVLR